MTTSQERIVPTDLRNEMSRSYLEYAMSVIVGRALPDVRDGLKPVHRRILYAMHELGLMPDRPFRKCARVVGEVLGKYHPHGDTAVYEALVRMAQDFSMRSPLINGHGKLPARWTTIPRRQCATRNAAYKPFAATHSFKISTRKPSILGITSTDRSRYPGNAARIPQLLLNGFPGLLWGWQPISPPTTSSSW